MGYKKYNLAELTQWGQKKLSSSSPSVRSDTEHLLCESIDRDRAFIYSHAEFVPTLTQSQLFRGRMQRREQGEPVAYILGHRGFWNLDLKVTSDTLIPRPETEILVEQALSWLPTDAQQNVLDLGTGSGAIALALAQERPGCNILALDICQKALKVATTNARSLGLRNVSFRHSSWYQDVAGEQFDLILSNPPYIDANDPHLDAGDLRFEPRLALSPGVDGLDDLRRIIAGASAHLRRPGCIMLEHGYQQSTAVAEMMRHAGFDAREVLKDLSGHERVSTGRLVK